MDRAPAGRSAGLTDLLGYAISEVRRLASDFALLAALDARRATIRLAWLLSAGLAVAVLLVTAWMGAVAALVVYLLGVGTSWAVALGVAGFINVAAAAALAWWMRHLIHEVPFTALVRQLRGEEPKD